METEIIDKLFLELSQITSAKTGEEIRLANEVYLLRAENEELRAQIGLLKFVSDSENVRHDTSN